MATILLIDGENFKGKIRSIFKEAHRSKPVWHTYNFRGLLNTVTEGITIDQSVFYFARIKEYPESKEKSQQLVKEQRLLKTHLEHQGFEVKVSGRVRGQTEEDASGKKVLVFREKGVDVQIAVDMMKLACDKKATTILLGSSDSDLQPAIQEMPKRGVMCIYVGFEMQPNKGISYTTSRTVLIRNAKVLEFDNEVGTNGAHF